MSGKKHKSSKKTDIKTNEKEAIPFSNWFHSQLKAGNLKFWQENELLVFFKEMGLSDNEEPDKYSELLKLY